MVLDACSDLAALAEAEQESLQEILNYQNNCFLTFKFQDVEDCSESLAHVSHPCSDLFSSYVQLACRELRTY